jgi:REP element-mobilizing transposase RayT
MLNYHSAVERRQTEWFSRLTDDERKMIRNILEDCAERTLANFFCLVDGAAGNYKGVFEIVAVEGNRRKALNPQNTEMLHDIFSEICEEGR